MDNYVRRELDEAWGRREKAYKAWREAKGTAVERERRKEFARAGRVLNCLQREGYAEVFRCPRPMDRKTDKGGRLYGLLCVHERGEPRNILKM